MPVVRDGGEIVGEETTEEAGTVESVEANIGRGPRSPGESEDPPMLGG